MTDAGDRNRPGGGGPSRPGRGAPAGGDRWTGGSGYLIGSRLVLTAAHNVDYRRDLG